MPRYDFRCMKCDKIDEDIVLPITHLSSTIPRCCKQTMSYHISSPPQVLWKDKDLPDGGFVAGKKKERITTKRERREFMAKHDLVDSNDFITPPSHEEQMDTHADVLKSVAAITPDDVQKEQMKDSGILDIV